MDEVLPGSGAVPERGSVFEDPDETSSGHGIVTNNTFGCLPMKRSKHSWWSWVNLLIFFLWLQRQLWRESRRESSRIKMPHLYYYFVCFSPHSQGVKLHSVILDPNTFTLSNGSFVIIIGIQLVCVVNYFAQIVDDLRHHDISHSKIKVRSVCCDRLCLISMVSMWGMNQSF